LATTLRIKWNRKALQQFDDAIAYIEAHSPANAEKAKKNILTRIDELLKHPERYNPDKYKIRNDNSYRAFEIHQYRISYRYKHPDVRIIRVRHVKMNPLSY
jgi:plasmid stabilization system protein ParE